MLKLIRLEWKKNHAGKYIRNVTIMSVLICEGVKNLVSLESKSF